MDDILKLCYQSLCNYYNMLEKTGYVNFNKVRQLLLLSYIEDILKEFGGFITNSDYTILYNIVSCLMEHNCLIPYERYKIEYKKSLHKITGKLRMSEEEVIRQTQDNSLRSK